MTPPAPALVLDTLWSFAYHRKTDIAAIREAAGPDALLVLDSGAFTAHTQGKPVRIADFMAWLDDWAGQYDHAVTLDVIGDPKATAKNTKVLTDAGYAVAPVFTVGESPRILPKLAAAGHHLVYAGGLVPLRTRRQLVTEYLADLSKRAADHGIAVHGLGIGSTALITAAGLYSGDAATAVQSPTRGMIVCWDGGNPKWVKASDRAALRKHRDWITGVGVPVADLLSGDVFKHDSHRPVRDALVASGLWAYVVAGWDLRRRTRRPFPGQLPAGPRMIAAAGSGVSPTVFANVARSARTDPPVAVRRATRGAP